MVSAPRFSILLPTHNRPDVIGYAIQSVLRQSEPDFELLVVGDGAVAGTEDVVRSFDDARIRWFGFPKAPAFGYANRNLALAKARGRFIAHMSDDDLMLPDHLELMGGAFADPAVQWAYAQALWVSADGIAGPDLTNLSHADERDYFLRQNNTISAGVFVYRSGAFGGTPPWPESLPEAGDWEMMKQLLVRHGTAGMARLGEPTLLHFKAKWKDGRDSRFPLLRAWLDIADRAAWWPGELRAPLQPDQPPQARYAQRLAEPGSAQRLRRAAADATARVALDRLVPRVVAETEAQQVAALRTLLEAADADRSVLRTQWEAAQTHQSAREAGLRGEVERLGRQVQALRGSTSWRLTGPLRALGRLLRGRKP